MQNNVAEALRAMAKGDENRSETARLRDVFPEIEAALNAGVRRSAILEAFHSQGFTMTLKSFESALYRIRKQRAKIGSSPVVSTQIVGPATTPPEANESGPTDNSAGLDKKQRREQLANKYIGNESTLKNPLVTRLLNQENKE